MSIINKIKSHGFRGSVEIVSQKIVNKLNKAIFDFNKVFPLQENLIVFESDGDFSDNSFALFDYLRKHGSLKKYKFVWLVNDKKIYKKKKFIIMHST